MGPQGDPRQMSNLMDSRGRANAPKYVHTGHRGGTPSHRDIPEFLWRAEPTSDKAREMPRRGLGRLSTGPSED